jgi:NAD+ kinase
MNVGVVGNARYDGLPAVLRTVADAAARHQVSLYLEEGLESAWPPGAARIPERLEPSTRLDALLTLGGDGTLLRGARLLAGRPIPILGVNLGRVGFLTSATVDECGEALEFLLTGRYEVSVRQALASVIEGPDGSTRPLPHALNDVVVHKTGVARMIRLEVAVDGEPVGPDSADGIIVASPTGSTAYSLSAGGPIVSPGVEAIAITPICAHTLAVRPLVIPATRVITIRPVPGWEHDLLVSADGQAVETLTPEDQVQISRAAEGVHLVQLPGTTYIQRIRHTLHWGDLSEREEE